MNDQTRTQVVERVVHVAAKKLIPRWLAGVIGVVTGVGAGVGAPHIAPHIPVPTHKHEAAEVEPVVIDHTKALTDLSNRIIGHVDARVLYTCGPQPPQPQPDTQ